MSLIARQSFYSLLFNFSSFFMAAINAYILVPFLLENDLDKWGLVNILVIYATYFSVLSGLGLPASWIKFFFKFKKKQNDSFITFILLSIGIVSMIFLGIICIFDDYIISLLNINDPLLAEYFLFIAPLGISIVFFDMFFCYSISSFKVVFPILLSTNYHRILYIGMILLYYFSYIDLFDFIMILVIGYFVRLLILIFYIHFLVKPIKIKFNFSNLSIKEILKYSLFILFSYFCASFFITIDRVFVSIYFGLENLAIYSFAVYAATQIITFYNSMHNSVLPLLSKSIADNNMSKLEQLYKKTSIISLVLGGFYFVILVSNIDDIYEILPDKFLISINILLIFMFVFLLKLPESINEHIISNSKFYKFGAYLYLFFVTLAVVMLFIASHFFKSMIYIALFTSLVYLLKSITSIIYLFIKMSIVPFTNIHLFTILFIISLSLIFRNIQIISDSPIYNIIIKTFCLSFIYFLFVLKTRLFPDLKNFCNEFIFKKNIIR